MRFDVTTPVEENLILNLRDYPNWQVALNGAVITTRIQRDDGLITIPVPSGSSTIDINYIRSVDQIIGNLVSLVSVAVLIATVRRSKQSNHRL
jgi:hypothetical protein